MFIGGFEPGTFRVRSVRGLPNDLPTRLIQHSRQQKVGLVTGGSGLDYPLPGQVWRHFCVFPARTNAKSGPLFAKVAPALRQSRAGLTRHLGRFTPNPGRQQILGEPTINTAKVGPAAGGSGLDYPLPQANWRQATVHIA